MKLKITRISEYDGATYGVLSLDDKPMFVTLEDAWRNNAHGISCIPKGVYKCQQHKSPKFGNCYHVLDVPERSEILIHAGNTHEDTSGCILVGLMFGALGTHHAILSSRSAMAAFLTQMRNVKECELEIV